jgi:hypothetical protein
MITILKLSSGVEVVGKEEVEDANSIVLNKPLQINYRYFQGSMPSVSFVRYIMFAQSEDVLFSKRDIVNRVVGRTAFAGYYTNVVDQYYSDLEKVIDRELAITEEAASPYEQILEMMPVDGATIN